MSLDDLRQLISRGPKSSEDKFVNGVFVFNHQLEIEPSKRSEPFPPNVIETAKNWNICLLSTSELLKLINSKLADEDISGKLEALFKTPGMFSAS